MRGKFAGNAGFIYILIAALSLRSHRKCRYHMLVLPLSLPVTVKRTPRSIALWNGDHGVWQHSATHQTQAEQCRLHSAKRYIKPVQQPT